MTMKSGEKLIILVEGIADQTIVRHLLTAMGGNVLDRVVVKACNGKIAVRHEYRAAMTANQQVIALVDADEPSVPDAEAWARAFFGADRANVFCAVPTIEAWVLADKEIASKYARQTDYTRSVFGRLVTPESIINVKILLNQVFDRAVISSGYAFLAEINIGRAVASSTSLFRFLRGVETALGHEWTIAERKLSVSLNRMVFANLLREIPSQTIGWKTLTGEYTAEQLGDFILQGDELGLRYVSELLRLARDILEAQAQPDKALDSDA